MNLALFFHTVTDRAGKSRVNLLDIIRQSSWLLGDFYADACSCCVFWSNIRHFR